MKDNEIRGIVLKKFYAKRNSDKFFPKAEDFPEIEFSDVFRVCEQLHEHGLLKIWKTPGGSRTLAGFGVISASGVDTIEGTISPPIAISITHQNNSITVGDITGSSGVAIGSSNVISIENNLKEIIEAIKLNTHSSEEEKSAALSILKQFVSHPLVVSIAGGAIGLLG